MNLQESEQKEQILKEKDLHIKSLYEEVQGLKILVV